MSYCAGCCGMYCVQVETVGPGKSFSFTGGTQHLGTSQDPLFEVGGPIVFYHPWYDRVGCAYDLSNINLPVQPGENRAFVGYGIVEHNYWDTAVFETTQTLGFVEPGMCACGNDYPTYWTCNSSTSSVLAFPVDNSGMPIPENSSPIPSLGHSHNPWGQPASSINGICYCGECKCWVNKIEPYVPEWCVGGPNACGVHCVNPKMVNQPASWLFPTQGPGPPQGTYPAFQGDCLGLLFMHKVTVRCNNMCCWTGGLSLYLGGAHGTTNIAGQTFPFKYIGGAGRYGIPGPRGNETGTYEYAAGGQYGLGPGDPYYERTYNLLSKLPCMPTQMVDEEPLGPAVGVVEVHDMWCMKGAPLSRGQGLQTGVDYELRDETTDGRSVIQANFTVDCECPECSESCFCLPSAIVSGPYLQSSGEPLGIAGPDNVVCTCVCSPTVASQSSCSSFCSVTSSSSCICSCSSSLSSYSDYSDPPYDCDTPDCVSLPECPPCEVFPDDIPHTKNTCLPDGLCGAEYRVPTPGIKKIKLRVPRFFSDEEVKGKWLVLEGKCEGEPHRFYKIIRTVHCIGDCDAWVLNINYGCGDLVYTGGNS